MLYEVITITRRGLSEISVAVLPWLYAMLVFLIAITYIPELSLWLPRTLGML